MGTKVVLFDVDGVLIDSEGVFNSCWREAAELEGYKMTHEQALQLRSLDADVAKDLFFEWYGDTTAYQTIRSLRKLLMAKYIQETPLQAKMGVKESLIAIKRLPISLAVVSSSPMNRIKDYLSSAGIDSMLFDSIITTELVKHGKPFPDVYQEACHLMGYEPYECIAVEDSPNGVKSAHAAGCFTIMIPDLTPYSVELQDCVDRCFSNIRDLVSFLELSI